MLLVFGIPFFFILLLGLKLLVNHMKSIGPTLGTNVTLVEVKDGLHDLFLSPERVRNFALKEMLKWIKMEL